ncbi:sulfurtransferase TusA family protein [Gudongella sp. DL1XJH-153]|uniref:sulfurtransferase TusA family protein n=1 Tax=Gudongella sp. DL1XJH-153 TaxID=3409804 RepID=UPI003BB6211A
MEKIDARGMSCPQPVLLTKNAIKDKPVQIQIVVDNETAKGNIERFLTHEGYEVSFDGSQDDIIINGLK